MGKKIKDRLNSKLNAAVNKGLAAMYLQDFSAGIKIMRDAGVPAETAERVALKPQSRRATDWKR